MNEPLDHFEQLVIRRHRLELALFRLLPPACRNGLSAPTYNSGCDLCRHMVNHVFLDPNQPEELTIDTALYHLASIDDCESARILRRAEAERALERYNDAPPERSTATT